MMARLTLSSVVAVLLAFICCWVADAHHDPNVKDGRSVAVHLFEWKWTEIAKECERFLGPNGFAAVQVSPPNEHAVVGAPWRPWWESYQPVSYKLESRRGNRQQFADMVRRCNNQGVRIYVDAVVNHMAANGGNGRGSGGSGYNPGSLSYSGVPFGGNDFNGRDNCHTGSGNIENYGDANQVRNCRLVGLPDLRVGSGYVRGKIAGYFNDLISLGVAGIRIDAAKHMWPGDIHAILGMTRNLNTDHGFKSGARLFVYQEVIDMGGEPIKKGEYVGNGRVTEFKYGIFMGQLGRRQNQLKNFRSFGSSWGMLGSNDAWVFVDNHDNQRGHGGGGAVVTHREPTAYKIANAFMMAFPYGFPKIMSSYTNAGGITGGNNWVGPPANGDGSIRDVPIKGDGTCGDNWVCEHRWRQIRNMVGWRNAAGMSGVANWWDNGNNQIAFSRGNRAFIAFNNEDGVLDRTLSTGLPAGAYCDVMSGDPTKTGCTGNVVNVDGAGRAHIVAKPARNYDTDPIVAIHVNAKSGGGSSSGGGGGPTNPPPVGGDCNKNESERVECGFFGIQQHQCEGKGCCWKPSSRNGVPWCFNK